MYRVKLYKSICRETYTPKVLTQVFASHEWKSGSAEGIGGIALEVGFNAPSHKTAHCAIIFPRQFLAGETTSCRVKVDKGSE